MMLENMVEPGGPQMSI